MSKQETRKNLEDQVAGHPLPLKRRRYTNTKVMEEYRTRDLTDYLRGIAHNFDMQSLH